MSSIYKIRFELVFLVKHIRGPKMTIDAAAKFLRMSRGWAMSVLAQYEKEGNVDFSDNRGTKRATTEKQDLEIVEMALGPAPMTTQQIADKMAKKGVKVGRITIASRLKEHGLRFKNCLKKPLLKQIHIDRRLTWANTNIDRDWTRVIFSDESTFELSCGATRAWQMRGDPKLLRTVKHPPKVSVWGCFSAKGFGTLVLIHGTLESKQMIEIYEKGLIPSAQKFYGEKSQNWHLLEDRDPKHTSKVSKAWKAKKKVKVLDWPAQSPDLNPIENVWALIKARLRQKEINTLGGLIRAIKQEWNSLTIEYAKKLAQSCARRCKAVIDNNGDWIPY